VSETVNYDSGWTSVRGPRKELMFK
jgi:hypothetical protein